MRSVCRLIGLAALAGTIVPPALIAFHVLSLESLDVVKRCMLVSAIAWLVTAPVWMHTD